MLNVVARRRSSGGPELVVARIVRSPSASLPAAESSPSSGLLTQRVSQNASSVAPVTATRPMAPKISHNARMLWFSGPVDRARMTVPTIGTVYPDEYTGIAATSGLPVSAST